MSFSTDVKKCLCKAEFKCDGCRRAELAGFFRFTGRLDSERVRYPISLEAQRKRVGDMLSYEFGISPNISGTRAELPSDKISLLRDVLGMVELKNNCCRIAFTRGAFLGGGSVSDPTKEYHLEFCAKSDWEADVMTEVLESFGIKSKRTRRGGTELVYIKESAMIADLLGYMSDGHAGLEVLSVQVEKNLKSSAQRQVNCDSANLNKLAKASLRHITAIKKIKAAHKWSSLPDVLREIGELRLRYPDISIAALGEMTERKIGKSGVNHRLNRIVEFSEGLPVNALPKEER